MLCSCTPTQPDCTVYLIQILDTICYINFNFGHLYTINLQPSHGERRLDM